jgi:hypothetical protein
MPNNHRVSVMPIRISKGTNRYVWKFILAFKYGGSYNENQDKKEGRNVLDTDYLGVTCRAQSKLGL